MKERIGKSGVKPEIIRVQDFKKMKILQDNVTGLQKRKKILEYYWRNNM